MLEYRVVLGTHKSEVIPDTGSLVVLGRISRALTVIFTAHVIFTVITLFSGLSGHILTVTWDGGHFLSVLEGTLCLRARLLDGLKGVIEILLVIVIMLDLLFKGVLLVGWVRLSGNTAEGTLLSLTSFLPVYVTIGPKIIIIIVVFFRSILTIFILFRELLI